MSSPSVLSALQKLREIIGRQDKIKCLGITGFALCVSLLEVLTASIIVVFVQVLNQPESAQMYLKKLGFGVNLSHGRVIFYISIVIGLVYLVKNLLAGAEVFFQNFTIQKMNCQFKNKILHRYSEVDYGFYLTRNSNFGIAIIGDVDQIFSIGMISIANIASESVVFFCLTAMVVFLSPTLALTVLVIGMILGLFVAKIMLPQFYRWGQRLQEASLSSAKNLTQFFHGFKEIILLGKRGTFIDSYQYYLRKHSHIRAIQTATNSLPRIVIEILFVGLFVSAILCLCLEHENPVQTIGILGGYLYLGFRIMPGLTRVINHLSTFKSIIPCIERLYKECSVVIAKENYIDVPTFSFEKSIKFTGVSFRYLNTEKDALCELSFEINKGEIIGIVGETGSGKSTLVDVLLGLLRPCKGSVLVDDEYTVNAYQWHKEIGYVPQSIYLTDDTIEANIAFGEKEVNSQRLNEVIDAAQLRKFINQLPNGEKTLVGERGVRLSGGERQRISIARALYRNPEVLIFDEATSALDNDTETKLMETIYSVSKNRTVIMIAHRLTTLKKCDRILVMEKGNLVQITSYLDIQQNEVKNHA